MEAILARGEFTRDGGACSGGRVFGALDRKTAGIPLPVSGEESRRAIVDVVNSPVPALVAEASGCNISGEGGPICPGTLARRAAVRSIGRGLATIMALPGLDFVVGRPKT